jgi:uncharacterized protein YegJ (DUF2314 family)
VKRIFALAAAPLLALATAPLAALAQDEPDIVEVDADDPEMNAAKAEAQRTLPQFLAFLANPPAGSGDFVIKFPLGGWEHIWVSDVVRRGQVLVGRLANDPVEKDHAIGDEVSVPLAEVSDWAWRDADGVMQGHFTTRVLLSRIDPEEADYIRAYMGWD